MVTYIMEISAGASLKYPYNHGLNLKDIQGYEENAFPWY